MGWAGLIDVGQQKEAAQGSQFDIFHRRAVLNCILDNCFARRLDQRCNIFDTDEIGRAHV